MRIEFLGTGGAITTPRPGCACRVCAEARVKGVPYSRTGPSVFIHGPDVLIDTPEVPDALSHDDLLIVADQVSEQGGRDISFAYDTLSVEV